MKTGNAIVLALAVWISWTVYSDHRNRTEPQHVQHEKEWAECMNTYPSPFDHDPQANPTPAQTGVWMQNRENFCNEPATYSNPEAK